MSGRIRSLKPEWLEDERIALASPAARVLSVALLLLADDYGNGRAGRLFLFGRVFPGQPAELCEAALQELVELRYILLYEVDGQRYFAVRNWGKHQRVEHPGKPLVPAMGGTVQEPSTDGWTYLARKGPDGPIKIGFSINPLQRATQLSRQQPDEVSILASMPGRKHEKALHRRFSHIKRRGEWFEPAAELLAVVDEWRAAETGNGRATDGQRTGNGHVVDVTPDRDRDRDMDQRPPITRAPTRTREPEQQQPDELFSKPDPTLRIRCPLPVPVPLDTLAGLNIAVGLPEPVAVTFLAAWSLKQNAKTTDLRTLDAWCATAVAAVTGEWSKGGERREAMRAAARVEAEDRERAAKDANAKRIFDASTARIRADLMRGSEPGATPTPDENRRRLDELVSQIGHPEDDDGDEIREAG